MRRTLRSLFRRPTFAVVALTCIALGVGVTTTMFSAVNGLLVRALPFHRADELIVIYSANRAKNVHGGRISWADYASWRDDSRALADAGVWTTYFPTLTGEGDVERVDGAVVSGNLLPLLGVAPLHGRTLKPGDDVAGSADVAVLSFGLWQRRYGADPAIVGHAIQIGNRATLVVGIMPAGFDYPDRTQIWTPLVVDPSGKKHDNRSLTAAVGRLSPGTSFEAARSSLAVVSAGLASAFPRENTDWEAEPAPLRDDLVGALRRPLLILFGASAFVLLIGCANVGNVMLARAADRRRELAVRMTLGASRIRLIGGVLSESLWLSAIGGALGTVLAFYGVHLLTLAFPDGVPSYFRIAIDAQVVIFIVGVSTATGVLFGLVPALRATRASGMTSIRAGQRGAASGESRRVRNGLVLAEIALSLVLLIGATLLIRSDLTLERELGFDARGVVTFRIPLPSPKYDDAGRRQFYETLFARLRASHGVIAAGSAQGLPFGALGGSYDRQSIGIEGGEAPVDAGTAIALRQQVSTEYLAALGVPILAGRTFTREEQDSGAPVGVVNELFVRRFFPGQSGIGRRFKLVEDPAATWITVIGVARNIRHDQPPRPIEPVAYLPYRQGSQTIAVRTTLDDPLTLVPVVRSLVRELDPGVPTYLIQTLDHVVEGVLWRQRLQGRVLGVFAGLAMVLAIFGIYAVVSYTVAQRTQELGVRLALGASRGQVLGLVLAHGSRLALLGLAIGVPAALALSGLLAGLLYEVRPTDVSTFAGVSVALFAAAMVATIAPARRAAMVDPLIAMRDE